MRTTEQQLYFLFLIFLVVGTICGFPHPAISDDDFQIWTSLNATGKFSAYEKIKWWMEVQPRYGDNGSDLERLLIQAGLGYELRPKLILWAAYGWTPLFMNSNYEDDFSNENRLFQQATYTHEFQTLDLFYRLRFEERDIDGITGTVARLRAFIKASKKIKTLHGDSSLGVATFNEYFYNLNPGNPSPDDGPDRNRLFAGPYWQQKHLRTEVGYIFEAGERKGRTDRHIHAVGAFFSFLF